jgi:hypothetical protein
MYNDNISAEIGVEEIKVGAMSAYPQGYWGQAAYLG